MKNILVAAIIFIPVLLCSSAYADLVTSINVKEGQAILYVDNHGEHYYLTFGHGSSWSSPIIVQVFAGKRFARMRRDFQKDFRVIKFKNFGMFYEFNDFISQNFQNLGECINNAGDKCTSYVWFLP